MYTNVLSVVLLSTFLLSNASWLMELFHSSFGALTQQLLYVMFECRLIVTLCLFDALQTSDLSCLTSVVSYQISCKHRLFGNLILFC